MAPRMSKRFIQVWGYAALTVLFLIFIVVYYHGMNKIDTIDVSYFQAQRIILFAGAGLLGVGLSLRKAVLADAWFLSVLGGVLLTTFLVLFFSFGGLSGAFDADGYAAANAQMLVLDGVAIACFVRCVVSAARLRQASARKRIAAGLLCVILAIAISCLIITGTGTRLVPYDEAAYTETEY